MEGSVNFQHYLGSAVSLLLKWVASEWSQGKKCAPWNNERTLFQAAWGCPLVGVTLSATSTRSAMNNGGVGEFSTLFGFFCFTVRHMGSK